jgi:hypothetical protein
MGALPGSVSYLNNNFVTGFQARLSVKPLSLFSQPLPDKYPEDEARDGLRNVGFLTAQPFDPADSPRKLDQSLGAQKISLEHVHFYSPCTEVLTSSINLFTTQRL